MRSMLARLVSAILVLSAPLLAQDAVATRAVNFRSDHSAQSQIIDHLSKGEKVTLLSTHPTKGFYHVQRKDGTKGWAYKAFVQELAVPTPPASGGGGGGGARGSGGTRGGGGGGGAAGASHLGGVATTAIDPTWTRPAPVDADFGSCLRAGSGGDSVTNLRKNRVDLPTSYHSLPFETIAKLAYPINHLQSRIAGPKGQKKPWKPADLAVLARYEGVAITLTGFVASKNGLKVETGGETTNCEAHDPDHVDWHVTLVGHPDDAKSLGIVVETTPRVRALPGHGWTPSMLATAIANRDSVRVSGWLMYDPEHFANMPDYDPSKPPGKTLVRATLWEIHPITKLEVFDPATKKWKVLP